MMFFSNGQNDPSSSSGNSSGSGSDSEENRFYKKNINSQRQQSSSTSASESESDSEQVSSRPAADNPTLPPSPKKDPETPPALKKKPSASDSSAVRNQGTPSEPTPKSPSASKPKRVLTGKSVKDDDSDEEQSERKKKKETRDVLVEFIRDVKKMTENSEAEMRALLDSAAGRRANSAAWLRNREHGQEDVYSIREIPGVDEARVQAMEEKWRKLEIRELELRSRRFALLQEQCSMQIAALKETSGNARIQ